MRAQIRAITRNVQDCTVRVAVTKRKDAAANTKGVSAQLHLDDPAAREARDDWS